MRLIATWAQSGGAARPMRMWGAALAALCALGCLPRRPNITTEELTRRTQELFDAVAGGDRRPWQRSLAEDCLTFDEKGRAMDKKAVLADLVPLPAGYSGTIKLARTESRILEETAVLSYDLDETETVYGQILHARYHGTDTWVLRRGQWQIIAQQMLRYYEDPSPGKTDKRLYSDYVGSYELAAGVIRTVTEEGGELYSERTGRAREVLIPEAEGIFFRKGVEGRILFRRGDRGVVDALVDRRNNEDVVWRRGGKEH